MNTKKMVYTSILTAMAFVLTWVYQIKIANGYVHFGDSILYIAVFLFGGPSAAFVGAVGGALADIASGYVIYALPTAVIKTLMALAAAFIYNKINNKAWGMFAAFLTGGVILALGYYIAEVIILQSFLSPIVNIPMNGLQALFSVILPIILVPPLRKVIK